MSIVKATLNPVAQQQQELWNSAGPHVVRTTYSPPAGTHWAVVGCVMAAAFDPDSHENPLVSAIEALSEVTSVASPRVWGETPSSILVNPDPPEDPTHECIMHVYSTLNMSVGETGDKRARCEQEHETIKPPLDKQWLVLNLVVPEALDAAKIAALEAALESVQLAGQDAITKAEHLIDGTVRNDATQVSLQIESRIRIDRIPEEP